MTERFTKPNKEGEIKGYHNEHLIAARLFGDDESGLRPSDVFIKKMMEFGAGVELSCSNFETVGCIKEAKDLYLNHFNNISNDTLQQAIKHVKSTQANKSMPYLLLGDVADLINILTGEKIDLKDITY